MGREKGIVTNDSLGMKKGLKGIGVLCPIPVRDLESE